MAGFGDRVPPTARILAAELTGIGKQVPLSAEKLSPVLALYFLPDRESCFQRCSELLHFGGLGHTCVIHAQDGAVVREYGQRMPAFRVVVNSPSPLGSIGATTNLFPAMTLGCGAVGGNITGDNIGPQHLMNIKRIAWNRDRLPPAPPPSFAPAAAPPAACACQHKQPAPATSAPDADRAALRELVEKMLADRGIRPRVAAPPAPDPPAPSPPAPPAPAAFVPPPLPETPRPVSFVCEADVREASHQGRKIPIGPRTIVTPAARDLGRERDVFLTTEP